MAIHEDVVDFIETIYDQIGTDSLWPSILDRYCKITKSVYVCIAVLELQHAHRSISLSTTGFSMVLGMDLTDQRLYAEYYANQDPWLTRTHEPLPLGQLVPGYTVCPDQVLVRTEIYNEFLRPLNAHYGGVLALLKQGSRSAVIAGTRSKSAGPYDESESIAVHRLVPHLQRAVHLHFELENARSRGTAVLASLEQFPSAVFVVDSNGRTIATNAQAERTLLTKDGLSVKKSILTTFIRSESDVLMRKISIAATDQVQQCTDDGVCLVSRPSGREPYRVFVSPFPTVGAFPFSRRAALVFVSDPDAKPVSEIEALKKGFCLTKAESRLVAALANGLNLNKAAECLGISRNTAKTQLQGVYRKTTVKNQAELMKLLYTMPRPLLQYPVLER